MQDNETILQSHQYKSTGQRERIVSDWIKLYGDRINYLFIQISPDVQEDRIRVDGGNMNQRKKYDIVPDLPKNIVRPPAIYTNINRGYFER
jgi:hypothetical protein